MDEIAEEIWVKYGMPEALVCPDARNAYELARRMGLDIQYLPVYDHNGINSIMVFEDTAVRIGNDKTELRPDETKERITDSEPKTVLVPANTIIVNINVVNKDYSSFNIFHECIHYELHYAFFRLQSMTSNDVRLVNAIEIEEEKAKGYKDPIYFMEKQANRGAYGLMMPAAATRKMIVKERDKAENCRHNGERYEAAGKEMAKTLCLDCITCPEDSLERLMELGHEFEDTSFSIDALDTAVMVDRALDELSFEERYIIEALFFNDKTEQRVADELGIAQKNVHKKKVRILAKLAKILSNE